MTIWAYKFKVNCGLDVFVLIWIQFWLKKILTLNAHESMLRSLQKHVMLIITVQKYKTNLQKYNTGSFRIWFHQSYKLLLNTSFLKMREFISFLFTIGQNKSLLFALLRREFQVGSLWKKNIISKINFRVNTITPIKVQKTLASPSWSGLCPCQIA